MRAHRFEEDTEVTPKDICSLGKDKRVTFDLDHLNVKLILTLGLFKIDLFKNRQNRGCWNRFLEPEPDHTGTG